MHFKLLFLAKNMIDQKYLYIYICVCVCIYLIAIDRFFEEYIWCIFNIKNYEWESQFNSFLIPKTL